MYLKLKFKFKYSYINFPFKIKNWLILVVKSGNNYQFFSFWKISTQKFIELFLINTYLLFQAVITIKFSNLKLESQHKTRSVVYAIL